MRSRHRILSGVAVVAATVSIAGPAQASTVRALWHMDALPSMTDSSGNGNNGRATSAVTLVAGS